MPEQGAEPRGWVPVVALLVLAPWAAECSWGGFAVSDYPLVILFLGPLYGGAAVLIREFARRTGAGWPAMVLLAAAFGIVQAGLVDQALFNPGFLDDTEYADLPPPSTLIPAFGFSAEEAFSYIGNHVLLSICAPIMLVESTLKPARRHRPWLRRRGLLGIGALYLLGSLMIFMDDENGRKGFMLTPAQAALAVTAVLILAGAAMLPRWRRAQRLRTGYVPHALLFGLLALAVQLSLWFLPGWPGVAARVAAVIAAVVLVSIWSRRAGWTQRHVVAGWSAGLIAAAAGAFFAPAYRPASALTAVLSDATVGVVTAVLVIGAYRFARKEVAREEVAREEVAREEVAREEVAREEVAREEVARKQEGRTQEVRTQEGRTQRAGMPRASTCRPRAERTDQN
ncbi:hypothetical protein OHA21_51915 [Actinoplanes sp. NBC_00393]|uniref:hypothetical protein n=1 Tax=Actinoplanes sp. NBC_00393 TaxID=2975953 RepID=UPI002E22A47D